MFWPNVGLLDCMTTFLKGIIINSLKEKESVKENNIREWEKELDYPIKKILSKKSLQYVYTRREPIRDQCARQRRDRQTRPLIE